MLEGGAVSGAATCGQTLRRVCNRLLEACPAAARGFPATSGELREVLLLRSPEVWTSDGNAIA